MIALLFLDTIRTAYQGCLGSLIVFPCLLVGDIADFLNLTLGIAVAVDSTNPLFSMPKPIAWQSL